MMNRIMMLKKLGIGIHLHYFSYNERGMPNELNQFCETIHVYERKTGAKGLSAKLPYIVSSRISEELINNLNKDDHPVLLEGLHCTGILPHIDLTKRKVVARMHNDESIYYFELSKSASTFLKRIFFLHESRLLKKYIQQLPDDCRYACISEGDTLQLKKQYHLNQVDFLPAFPSWQTVTSEEGIGNFCLYHGNLSVPENEKAAIWLLENVFFKIRKPFVIAGKNPSKRLQKIAELSQHTCLAKDPSEAEMNDLIRKAHINVLPSFNKNVTGVRLKLLHALYQGRHCLVNDAMVKGSGLEEACHTGTTATAFASIIMQLYNQPFTDNEILLRKKLLEQTYNNEKNTLLLIQWLY